MFSPAQEDDGHWTRSGHASSGAWFTWIDALTYINVTSIFLHWEVYHQYNSWLLIHVMSNWYILTKQLWLSLHSLYQLTSVLIIAGYIFCFVSDIHQSLFPSPRGKYRIRKKSQLEIVFHVSWTLDYGRHSPAFSSACLSVILSTSLE